MAFKQNCLKNIPKWSKKAIEKRDQGKETVRHIFIFILETLVNSYVCNS